MCVLNLNAPLNGCRIMRPSYNLCLIFIFIFITFYTVNFYETVSFIVSRGVDLLKCLWICLKLSTKFKNLENLMIILIIMDFRCHKKSKTFCKSTNLVLLVDPSAYTMY